MRAAQRLRYAKTQWQARWEAFTEAHDASLQKLKPVWLAVGAVLGCLTYFSLPTEPAWWWLFFLLPSVFLWRWPNIRFLAVGVIFFLYSWGLTLFHEKHQSRFEPSGQAQWLQGRVHDAQTVHGRTRIWLRDISVFDGTETGVKIPRLFLTVPHAQWEGSGLGLGDFMATEAKLYPPKAPQFEGDYDSRLKAFFTGEAAAGYSQGQVYKTEVLGEKAPWWHRSAQVFPDTLNRVRQHFVGRLNDENGLAVALLTGVRSHVPQAVTQAFRETGLSHLLAISGLHVGMVAALFFVGLRRFLALFPAVALRHNSKPYAAMGALVLAGGYMLLAGATVPTVRAFCMVALVLGAVMFRRPVQGLRLWALAVFVVLGLWPWVVISPSFQLSFAAVLGLGILYDWQNNGFGRDAVAQRFPQKVGYIKGIFITTLVASLCTFPLVLWHFGAISLAGLFMNFVAIPLLAFWILPVGLLTILTGFPEALVALLQTGTAVLSDFALWGASLGNSWYISQMRLPLWSGGILLISGITALLGVLRFQPWVFRLGFFVFIFTPFIVPKPRLPDVVFLEYGRLVLLRGEGAYHLVHNIANQKNPKVAERFARFQQQDYATLLPEEYICDGSLCTFNCHGQNILFAPNGALPEDCEKSDSVLSPYSTCSNSFWPQKGRAIAVYFHKKGLRAEAFQPTSTRPWEEVER